MTYNKAFKQFKKQQERDILPYRAVHFNGCNEQNSYTPINECACDCYEKYYFMVGYLSAKGKTPHLTNRDR